MWPSQNIRTLTENPFFCFFEDGTRRKRHSEILVNFVNTAGTVNCVISRSFCSFVLIRSSCRVQDKCKGVIAKKKLGSTKRLLQKFNISPIITKSWKSWIHDHEQVIVLKIEFFDPQETLLRWDHCDSTIRKLEPRGAVFLQWLHYIPVQFWQSILEEHMFNSNNILCCCCF